MRKTKLALAAFAMLLAAEAHSATYVLHASNWGASQDAAVASAGGAVKFKHAGAGVAVVESNVPGLHGHGARERCRGRRAAGHDDFLGRPGDLRRGRERREPHRRPVLLHRPMGAAVGERTRRLGTRLHRRWRARRGHRRRHLQRPPGPRGSDRRRGLALVRRAQSGGYTGGNACRTRSTAIRAPSGTARTSAGSSPRATTRSASWALPRRRRSSA